MPEQLHEINLLPKYERQSSRSFYLFIVLLSITLLAYLLIGYMYVTTNSKMKTAEAEYEKLREDEAHLQAEMDAQATEETSLDDAVAFVENYEIPTSALIVELDKLLPTHSYFSEYTYENTATTVEMHFETLDAVADYTTELLASDFITDTKVDEVSTFGLKEEIPQDEAVDFDTISRYESRFTLEINKQKLKGESKQNE